MPELNHESKLSKKTAKINKKLSKQLHSNQTQPTQIIVKKPNLPVPLNFSTVSSELKTIAEKIVDAKLQKRNTLVLAKLAKETFFKNLTADEKGSTHESNKCQSFQQPLLSKSWSHINDYYCNEISKELILSLTYFLKERKFEAKIIANVMIVAKPKIGFNMSALCFWDTTSDGIIDIRKNLKISGSKIPEIKQQDHFSESQLSSDSDPSSNSQQGLLIVAIYFCRFQQNFKSQNTNLHNSQ